MRLHFLKHVPFEGLGSIETWALGQGAHITCTRLYRDEQLPVDLPMDLLVVMGGPMGVHDVDNFPWLDREKAFLRSVIDSGIRILGICLGAQLIADVLGARVYPGRHKEIGWLPIESVPGAEDHVLGQLLAQAGKVFQWHGDTFDLPAGATWLARSEACAHQAFAVGEQILALQFHLETTADSAQALIDNCGHEITDAPYIQGASTMVQNGASFGRINRLMDSCLTAFAGKLTGSANQADA